MRIRCIQCLLLLKQAYSQVERSRKSHGSSPRFALNRVHVAQSSSEFGILHLLVGLALKFCGLALSLASELVGLALCLSGKLAGLALGLPLGLGHGVLDGSGGLLCE